jgi:hypothetical protein
MRPPVWNPPIKMSASEEKVAQRIRFREAVPLLEGNTPRVI